MNPDEAQFLISLERVSKARAVKALGALADLADTEARHVQADTLLLRIIADDRVSLAFYRLKKWYA